MSLVLLKDNRELSVKRNAVKGNRCRVTFVLRYGHRCDGWMSADDVRQAKPTLFQGGQEHGMVCHAGQKRTGKEDSRQMQVSHLIGNPS